MSEPDYRLLLRDCHDPLASKAFAFSNPEARDAFEAGYRVDRYVPEWLEIVHGETVQPAPGCERTARDLEVLASARRIGRAVWVLLLNNMRAAKVEIQTAVAKAHDPQDLRGFLERERVAPYRTDDRWGKVYRRGGPLEWFNAPYDFDRYLVRAEEVEGWLVELTPWLHELEAQFAPAGGGA